MTFRIGIIGAGFATEQYHLPAWTAIPGATVAALCDVDGEKAGRIGSRHGIRRIYDEYKDMLSDGGLDIVTVATPAYCHYQQILDALDSGTHVVTEKPMTVTHNESIRAARKSTECGKKLMCLQQSRFKNSTIQLKNAIEHGRMGTIYYGTAKSIRSRGVPAQAHFRLDPSQGGGPLYDSGPHIVDVAWFLMGQPELRSVTASSWSELSHSASTEVDGSQINAGNFECEDFVAAHLVFADNRVLNVEISYLANLPFDKQVECILWGTNATANWPEAQLYVNRGATVSVESLDPASDGHLGTTMLSAFLDSVKHDTDVPIDPLQTAEVIRFIEAIHTSCKSAKQLFF